MSPREILRGVLNALADPALVLGGDGQILVENQLAAGLLHPAQGDDPEARRTVELNNLLLSALVLRAESGELHLVDPVRGPRLFDAVSAPLPVELTVDGARLWTLRDITQRQRACDELEVRLEKQSRELESANRMKAEFLASMSHELRTPINALMGYTALLRDGVYGDLTRGQEEALKRVASASEHLLEMVTDLLDLARLQGRGIAIHPEPVALPDLLEHVVQVIEPEARAKQLAVDLEIEPDLPHLYTDRMRLRQVLMHLLSNAIKFTPSGEIAIHAQRAKRGKAVEIAVADTGIGIRREHIPVIWEEFRQVDQTWTREHEGTGLGLAITKQLVDLLGGTVRVRSRQGQGSVFTVSLPIRNTGE